MCRGEQGREPSSDPRYKKVRQLNLTSDQGGVGRSGFWRMGWGEGQDPEAQRHPILLVTFASWPIGFGSMLGWDASGSPGGRGLLPLEPFCGRKFLFRTTMTQLPSPTPGSALRHCYRTSGAGRPSRLL